MATCAEVASWLVAISSSGPPGRASLPACRQRMPRDKRYAFALAGLDHRLGGAVGQVVAVLDGDDGRDIERDHYLPYAHVGETDVPDLALIAQLGQGPDRVLEGDAGVGAVELVEVDSLQL
jgi:hypothetical protein